MGLISYCKKAFAKKSESKKVSAKRKIAEFRGLNKDCTATELIEKFKEFPHTTFPETIGMMEILKSKGDSFSFELLEKDFETAADILSKCHVPSSLLRLHRRWLISSGKYIPERQINSLVNRKLEESKAVTDIIRKAMQKMDETWNVNVLPTVTSEFYTTTLYSINDTEFLIPWVRTCEYKGYGLWDVPQGFYVAAWKEDKPYVLVPQMQKPYCEPCPLNEE